jgi:hypothetical protein
VKEKTMNLLSQPSLEHIPAPPADGRLRFFEDLGAAAAVIPTDRRSNHAPSIVSLRDGGLLTAWFGGSDEGNRDIDILVSRFDANTGTWSTSESVTNDEVRSDQNPGLFEASDGSVWLVYTSQLSRQSGVHETFNLQHTSVVKVIRSTDGGISWSEPEMLFDREGTFCRQPIQVLSDGKWAHTQWLCFDDDSKNGSDQPVVQISEDRGATWRQIEFPSAAGRVHPNIVELEPRSPGQHLPLTLRRLGLPQQVRGRWRDLVGARTHRGAEQQCWAQRLPSAFGHACARVERTPSRTGARRGDLAVRADAARHRRVER